MTKEDALRAVAAVLLALPDEWKCVVCGFTVPVDWDVSEGTHYDACGVTVEGGGLVGWCGYGGGDAPGLHCPKCDALRRQREGLASVPILTPAERDALQSPPEGSRILNADTRQVECYQDGAWRKPKGRRIQCRCPPRTFAASAPPSP